MIKACQRGLASLREKQPWCREIEPWLLPTDVAPRSFSSRPPFSALQAEREPFQLPADPASPNGKTLMFAGLGGPANLKIFKPALKPYRVNRF